MSGFLGIYKRELQSYFNSPIAYIFIVVFLLLVSWLFFRGYFLYGQADLRPLFSLLPWVFLFFVPAVAMRLWAEERKLGTMELLLTLPAMAGAATLPLWDAETTTTGAQTKQASATRKGAISPATPAWP